MTTIDPLRDGPRNDYIQALHTKYLAICREEGLTARAGILAALANLDAKGAMPGTDAISWVVAQNSHKIASGLLDSPDFRPLLRHWVDRFPVAQQEMAAGRLEDMGALAYQRAVRSGE